MRGGYSDSSESGTMLPVLAPGTCQGSPYSSSKSASVMKRPLSLVNTLAQLTASSASCVVVARLNDKQK
jgi:hypothetical protein